MENTPPRHWHDIAPEDAVRLNAATDPGIIAPLGEDGEPCPWPWEPQQLAGLPMGMYHCGYCGTMCLAGEPHPDYQDFGEAVERHFQREAAAGAMPEDEAPLPFCPVVPMRSTGAPS